MSSWALPTHSGLRLESAGTQLPLAWAEGSASTGVRLVWVQSSAVVEPHLVALRGNCRCGGMEKGAEGKGGEGSEREGRKPELPCF